MVSKLPADVVGYAGNPLSLLHSLRDWLTFYAAFMRPIGLIRAAATAGSGGSGAFYAHNSHSAIRNSLNRKEKYEIKPGIHIFKKPSGSGKSFRDMLSS